MIVSSAVSDPVFLDAGTYYLKETKAPDGYQMSDKIIEFTIIWLIKKQE